MSDRAEEIFKKHKMPGLITLCNTDPNSSEPAHMGARADAVWSLARMSSKRDKTTDVLFNKLGQAVDGVPGLVRHVLEHISEKTPDETLDFIHFVSGNSGNVSFSQLATNHDEAKEQKKLKALDFVIYHLENMKRGASTDETRQKYDQYIQEASEVRKTVEKTDLERALVDSRKQNEALSHEVAELKKAMAIILAKVNAAAPVEKHAELEDTQILDIVDPAVGIKRKADVSVGSNVGPGVPVGKGWIINDVAPAPSDKPGGKPKAGGGGYRASAKGGTPVDKPAKGITPVGKSAKGSTPAANTAASPGDADETQVLP